MKNDFDFSSQIRQKCQKMCKIDLENQSIWSTKTKSKTGQKCPKSNAKYCFKLQVSVQILIIVQCLERLKEYFQEKIFCLWLKKHCISFLWQSKIIL